MIAIHFRVKPYFFNCAWLACPVDVFRHVSLPFARRKVLSVNVVYGALLRALASGELILSRGITYDDRALDHIAILEACLPRQVTVVLPIQRQGGGNDMA